jgi:DNA sulfur modification protein DndD
MTLDEIVLTNFGVFRGEQRAVLTPPSKKKPVILFGGLNGGGKTTLLEGLQLALYGHLAELSRQDGRSYTDYLARSISHGVRGDEGASVEVAFRSQVDGTERQYRVRRTWSVSGSRVNESLDVLVDSFRDDVLSDTWSEQVERFIPARLAPLFFFDGERIESLADPDQSSQVLTTAIHALLGVDLVDQLGVDLTALSRRKRRDNAALPDQRDIDRLEEELAAARSSYIHRKNIVAELTSNLDLAKNQLAKAERALELGGGGLLEERFKLEKGLAETTGEMKQLRERMVQASAGVLPLIMLKPALRAVQKQASKELDADNHDRVQASINAHDQRLMDFVREQEVGPDIIKAVESFISSDASSANELANVERWLNLDQAGIQQTDQVLTGELSASQKEVKKLLTKYHDLEGILEGLDRRLAAVPDEEAISQQLADRESARVKVKLLTKELAKDQEFCDKLGLILDQKKNELTQKLRSLKHLQIEQNDTTRVIDYAGHVQDTLGSFRKLIVSKHTDHLESLILAGYRKLLRKKSLLNRIEIDPVGCSLRMYNGTDTPISPERLSAGERQLLAVSMLWGLGQAAARPIPIVVDTPLGRLDSSHRMHLVDRYFPKAAHQVILLSTDEEIDEKYYDKLKPSIGREYCLKHDDKTKSSTIREGYFWEN